MSEKIPTNPSDEDKKFLEEVRFIEERGREPDVFDERERDPKFTVQRLAESLDIYTNTAATVLTLLKLLEGSQTQFDRAKVAAIMSKFNFDGKHEEALMNIKHDLLELQGYLRTQIGDEKYFDEVLPQTKELEQRLKANSEFVRTAGESGEPLND